MPHEFDPRRREPRFSNLTFEITHTFVVEGSFSHYSWIFLYPCTWVYFGISCVYAPRTRVQLDSRYCYFLQARFMWRDYLRRESLRESCLFYISWLALLLIFLWKNSEGFQWNSRKFSIVIAEISFSCIRDSF
jgi:hypothetical protein